MKVLLFITLCFSFAAVLNGNPDWGKEPYMAKGVILLPYGNIVEPFEAWIDPSTKRSRIDYYEGMNSVIFLDGSGFKIVPKPPSDQPQNETMICYNVTGLIGFQHVLPDITGWTMEGSDRTCKHNGSFIDCTVYKYSVKKEDKENTYEMYTDKNGNPLIFNFTGYDFMLGSHYDHYEFVYFGYIQKEIPPGVFDYPARMRNCSQYPGPGYPHAELDPMTEFMESVDQDEKDKDATLEFNDFKKKYSKNYNSDVEHESRKSVFRQTRRFIHSKNRQNLGYNLAINHLSDLTEKEIKVRNGYRYSGIGESHRLKTNTIFAHPDTDIPDSINWVEKGAVNPPKDQGICGSCWSFGTTGTLEGRYFLVNGKLLDLSEQSLIDCTWDQGTNGCDGGETERVGNWLLEPGENHCVVTRENYAAAALTNDTKRGYLMADGVCHWKQTKKDICVKIQNYVISPKGDLDALKQFTAKFGPIQVGIDASLDTFTFYSSGIYYDENCHNDYDHLDHSVLLVGYGTENGQDYWLIKNSWSTYWGDNGYIKVSTKNNNCGVATDAVFFDLA